MDNIKEVLTDEESLTQWSVEIDPKKEGKLTQQIVIDLKKTMKANNLITLAAPQIGYNRRIICVKFGENDYRSFVNPAIVNNSNIEFARETCSSIPNKTFVIPRFNKIELYFTTPMGDIKSTKQFGFAAHKIQHAIDHLNGSLVSDIGLEIDELFDNATQEEREEVLKMYAESLDLRQKALEKEIEEDPDLKQIVDAEKFITSVKSGETKLEKI